MENKLNILLALFLLTSSAIAQSTINANDATAFIFGGGQQSNSLQINLLPIAIIDVEPDPGSGISFNGITTNLEAGLPSFSAINVNEDLWINFTHRSFNSRFASIFIASNQPIPASIKMYVEVANRGSNGNFLGNPVGVITLNEDKQVLVNNIPNGYTGDGLGFGFQLKYTILNPKGLSLPSNFEINYTIE